MRLDTVAAVEAAYRFDVPDDSWLQGVLEATRPLVDQGLGAWAFVFDGHAFVRGEMAYEHPTACGIPDPEWETGLRATLAITSRDRRTMLETIFGTPCHAMSEILRRDASLLRRARRSIAIPGVLDTIGVTARDPSGSGVYIGAHAPAIVRIDPRRRARLARLAAHFATAFRLRRRLLGRGPVRAEDLVAGSEAVIGRGARIEHAAGEAASRRALQALREAALAADRATRLLRRRDPDAALAAWEALVDGRWSLIGSFDEGGRRVLLAQRNEPAGLPGARRLSAREQQVAGYLLLGHPHKLIAYELGLSPGTVSTLAARVRDKLEASSPSDLIRKLQAVQRRGLARAPRGGGPQG